MDKSYFKLEHNPIIECVSEIRFNTDYPDEVSIALLYQKLKSSDKFKDFSFVPQPIIQLPPDFRKINPQLKYQPSYIAINNEFSLGISSNSIFFSLKEKYKSFEWLEKNIIETLSLIDSSFIKKLERISLRYINKIDDNLFTATHLDISYPTYSNKEASFIFKIENKFENGIISNLQFSNKVELLSRSVSKTHISIVDIDSFYEFSEDTALDLDLVKNKLNLLRMNTHDLFFQLFKESYIKDKFDKKYKA